MTTPGTNTTAGSTALPVEPCAATGRPRLALTFGAE